ncbi:MAG: hypothetical protein AABZ02_09610 [Bacteroidota bacterium]
MQYSPDHFYHLYNRGNNKQRIFLERENYRFFLNQLTYTSIELVLRLLLIASCRIIFTF